MKKISLIALFVTLISNLLVAQAPNWQWATGTGGSSGDRGSSVATDASGNAYVVGHFGSDTIIVGASTSLANAGINTTDMYVVKYDNTGSLVWAQRAGGTDYEYAVGVALDGSGNVYVTGYFNSASVVFGSTTLTNAGTAGTTNDMYVVKYDNNGTVLWAKSAGGTSSDRTTSICTYGADVYVTGYYNSTTLVFGSNTLTNAGPVGYNDMFIVKYDNSGTVQWAKSVGGTNIDLGNGIAADANGVYVTGNFYSSTLVLGSTTLTNAGSSIGDIFLIKYDTNGNVVWAKSAGGTSDDGGYSVAANGSAIYLTGKFGSFTIAFGSVTLNNGGNSDIFVAKYDNSGTVLWAKKAGGSNYDNSNCISVDAAGNSYVAGDFFSSSVVLGSTTLTNAGSSTTDIIVIKYDNSGNVAWAKSAGGTTSDIGFGITTNGLGDIYVTGDFTSTTLVLNSTTLTNQGTGDMFLGKLSDPTGVNTFSAAENSINISPNPTSGVFQVYIGNSQLAGEIEIYNVLGEKVYELNAAGSKEIINVTLPSVLQKGTYFLKIRLSGVEGAVTKKLVIQ